MRSFPALHFDVTKVSLASRREHQEEAVRFATGQRRTASGGQYVLSPTVISFDDVLQRSGKKRKGPREKLWSIGFYPNQGFNFYLFINSFKLIIIGIILVKLFGR